MNADRDGSGRPIPSARDQSREQTAIDSLRELPKVLAEVSLTDHQCFKAAAALAKVTDAGDTEFAAIFRTARDAYVDDMVQKRMDELDLLRFEAAEQLIGIYS